MADGLKGLVRRSIVSIEDRLTVRQQIGLSAAALCLVLVAVITTAVTYFSRQDASEFISRNMSTLARSMANQLEFGLRESYGDLRHLASLEPLTSTWTGPV